MRDWITLVLHLVVQCWLYFLIFFINLLLFVHYLIVLLVEPLLIEAHSIEHHIIFNVFQSLV